MDHLYSGETLFLNATWSGTQGAKLILALPSREDLAAFDCIRRGSRLACVLVPINDDETAGRVEKPLSVQAALLCRQPGFWEYVERRCGYVLDNSPDREQAAVNFLRRVCGVTSRAELDTDTQAAARFTLLQQQVKAAHLENAHG